MPHVTVEYSANLTDALDIQSLVDRIHEAVLASGPFERGAARTRAIECRTFRIADGRPDAAFIHVMMRIGHGRDRATKQAAGEAIFAAIADATADIFDRRPLGLTLEIHDIPPDLVWRKNNMHALFGSTPPR
jgi:5-carboxymethyl-2-hydroxymuconate isomerase